MPGLMSLSAPPPLSTPPDGLPPASITQIEAGTELWYIAQYNYSRGTELPTFRFTGPWARFDHHLAPNDERRGVLYISTEPPLLELLGVAGRTPGAFTIGSTKPWLIGFVTTRPLNLLDLTSTWLMRAGADMRLMVGEGYSFSQAWSRAIYEQFPRVDGLLYSSRFDQSKIIIALYERSADALPAYPKFSRPLADPQLLPVLTEIAQRYAFQLLVTDDARLAAQQLGHVANELGLRLPVEVLVQALQRLREDHASHQARLDAHERRLEDHERRLQNQANDWEKLRETLSGFGRTFMTLDRTTPGGIDMSAESPIDVVILTALPEEREAVRGSLDASREQHLDGLVYDLATLDTGQAGTRYQIVLVLQTSMGNEQAAILVERVITRWRPSHIILTGITGGVRDSDRRLLGDVLVADQIVAYEPGRQTPEGVQRRYQVYRPAEALIAASKRLASRDWVLEIKAQRPDGTTGRVVPQAHFSVVASGSKVVTDPALTTELQSDWSMLAGVEMEGAGASAAAYAHGAPGVLLVKGISDWADPAKADNWRSYAAEAAARFVVALLRSAPFAPKTQSPASGQHRVEGPVAGLYSGAAKIAVTRGLYADWQYLADFFEIPPAEQARFPRGQEAREIWHWLESRNRLHALPEALREINREDLLPHLTPAET